MKRDLVDTRAFPGNEGIEVYSDQDDPDLILLWEKWETRADHAAYSAWRLENGFLDTVAQFMDPARLRVVQLHAHDGV